MRKKECERDVDGGDRKEEGKKMKKEEEREKR